MKKFITYLILFFICHSAECQENKRLLLIDSLFSYICKSEILHPDIVFDQAMFETGWLKPGFLMKRNNLFGFRSKEYLKFNSWKDCVDYYKKWQIKYYKNPNENYYDFLLRIKYATSEYSNHLKKMKSKRSCR